MHSTYTPAPIPMPQDPAKTRSRCRLALLVLAAGAGFTAFATLPALAFHAKASNDDAAKLMVRVQGSAQDVLQAVDEVTQDQIIHGTYSYEKERILYGAHSATEAHVFGVWKGPGKAFYKVAGKVLAPRYFKDSGDIGTISVRYVIQEDDASGEILRIDAIFVDARNVRHPSEGVVESAEYSAIQDHLRKILTRRQLSQERTEAAAIDSQPSPDEPSTPGNWLPSAEERRAAALESSSAPESMAELEKQIEALRRQVELRVRDDGAQLKSAPFHSAATLESVPAAAEVVVMIVSPYWYGVETEDGHRGWIHHSQLEPLR